MIKTVDIIIPSYKPGDSFVRLLDMLEEQSYPYEKLIVINTGAEYLRADIRGRLEHDSRVLLKDITEDEFDHAATRAMAVGMSDADAFVCMTDDAVPADDALIAELISSLNEYENAAAAYARQVADEDAGEAEKFTRQFNYPETSRTKTIEDLDELGIKTFFASNVCCAYRREIYDRLGGFIASAIFNEDMIYASTAMKAGYSVVYNAGAVIIHSHDYTALQQFHRNFDLGMSQKQHPEVFGGLKSEGEGIKLVKNTVRHLAESGHAKEIPAYTARTAFRYAGYKAGKLYDKLPDGVVRAFAMNKKYVDRMIGNKESGDRL